MDMSQSQEPTLEDHDAHMVPPLQGVSELEDGLQGEVIDKMTLCVLCLSNFIMDFVLFQLSCSNTFVTFKIDVLVAPDSVRPLDESNPDEAELLIRRGQKEDSNAVIHSVRLKPLHKSRLAIPLCRLRCLPLVRPINDVDVSRLENEFVMGYRDGDRALYVSAYNNLDEQLHVSDDIQASWSTFWQEANEEFDTMLQNDSDLAHLAGKMFYVWEGNHRLTAWWRGRHSYVSVERRAEIWRVESVEEIKIAILPD